MGCLDKSLNQLLADLAERLAASGTDQILVRADDLAPAAGVTCAPILLQFGLLRPCEPARATICDGCDRGCSMEVQFSPGSGVSQDRAFVVCDKRDDIGRVPVNIESLRQWRMSMDEIAGVVAQLLGTDGPPRPRASPLGSDLGCFRHGREDIEATLVAAPDGGSGHGLTVTLCAPPHGSRGAAVALPSLVRFKDHLPRLNRTVLKRALNARFEDSRVAWEIKFERGDIVLVNHVTGQPKTIADPNFDSSNDNAFAALYAHPGRKFSLRELQEESRDRTISDLHKLVENLNFTGPLKKAFFRVSRDAICFQPTVSLGQLAALRIDPRTIS